jgi:flavin-dependent dehydrogenase
MRQVETFDAVVIGGGPFGAIPPRPLREFDIPESLLVARVRGARIVSPRAKEVQMPIADGFVGMVDRLDFDEWLRVRAAETGATRRRGLFERLERGAVGALRTVAGLDGAETLRREGAPIPLRPLLRWDNGRDVVLAGDAAAVVAPASGEGIYYAMLGGRLAAEAVEAVEAMHVSGDARALRSARRRFMKTHGQVFWSLGMMQRFWYANDARRERFVNICRDADVQQLTWDAYMNKELVGRVRQRGGNWV